MARQLSTFLGLEAAAAALFAAGVNVRLEGDDENPTEDTAFDNQSAVILKHEARITELRNFCESIVAKADADGRPMSEDEHEEFTGATTEIAHLEADIELRQDLQGVRRKAMANNTPADRRSAPADAPGNTVDRPANRSEQKRKSPAQARINPGLNGFESRGHFFNAVAMAAMTGQADQRLMIGNRKNTQMVAQESIGAKGGFPVVPDIANEIMKKVLSENSLLQRCAIRYTEKAEVVDFLNPDAPWESSGIQAQWLEERQKGSRSSPNTEEIKTPLNKLGAFVEVTEEVLGDNAQIESMITEDAPDAIFDSIIQALISGDGVKKPLGVLNAPGTVVIAKETSQDAGTVNYQNVQKLYNGLYAPCQRRAEWHINQDVQPELENMEFPGDKSPVYLPGGSLANAGHDKLKNRDVFVQEHCPALGTPGDIIAGDWSKYRLALQRDGVSQDYSMHVLFERDMGVFRFIFRVGGQPMWKVPVTLPNSATPRAAFTVLAERA